MWRNRKRCTLATNCVLAGGTSKDLMEGAGMRTAKSTPFIFSCPGPAGGFEISVQDQGLKIGPKARVSDPQAYPKTTSDRFECC